MKEKKLLQAKTIFTMDDFIDESRNVISTAFSEFINFQLYLDKKYVPQFNQIQQPNGLETEIGSQLFHEISLEIEKDIRRFWSHTLNRYEFYVNKMNLWTTQNLLQTKEFLSTKRQFELIISTIGSAIGEYFSSAGELISAGELNENDEELNFIAHTYDYAQDINLGENRPENIAKVKKIVWYGTKTDKTLALVLKILAGHGLIQKDYQPIADKFFVHEDGSDISHNLSTMANGTESKNAKVILEEINKAVKSTKAENK